MSRQNSDEIDLKSKSGGDKKKFNHTLALLMSCCLFLTIICACLLTALVLIGKHLVYNSTSSSSSSSSKMIKTFKSGERTLQFMSRLPNDTIPLKYDITLEPNIELANFKGFINITINITQSRKDLLIHSKNLTIESIDLRNSTNIINVVNIKEIQRDEIILILLKNKIINGIYYLSIKFGGSLEKRIGFYRSHYKTNDTGKERFIATSKFEPTYARQAYPCFDEPNLKATYKVHILKPKDNQYIALSNNPQISEEETDNGVLVHFNETVPMSTYLSCFIVCDFEYSETKFENDNKQTPFRVYASPGQLEKTKYAAQVGAKVIEYYINYFNIPYPLPKLDMIAIPDFVSGAMEHWGLVTFRETALLYTDKTHSSANKQRVATVVAHELAHSWFGNLVTMNWWNDLWLNEGFASYIEYKGVHHVHPTWAMLEQFIIEDLHSILDLDATQSSHPIIKTVTTPDQITEVFDAVSYNKGASILRMLESVVGEKNFQNGITNYLKKFSFGNAVTQDLLNELQIIVGNTINITEFINTFTIQMGYPILNIQIDGTKYILTQKRFLSDPETANEAIDSPLGYKWSVPVTYVTDKGTSEIFWYNYTQSQLIINKPQDVEWLKFNPNQVGYYRVNYPDNEWKLLKENIKNLTVADRTHLLEESFSIAVSGDLNYTIPLELTQYLVDEDHYIPWSVASTKLGEILNYLKYTGYEEKFKKYIISILKPTYEKLSWIENSNEEHLVRRARVVVLSLACSADYQDALSNAEDLFNNWINGTEELSQDLRAIIYRYGMINANEETWNKLFKKFSIETDANEKLKLMYGLASVQKPSLLIRLIDLAKDETYVRSQDYFTLLSYISNNPIGVPIVWDYVRENWLELVKRFTLNDRYLGRLIPSITGKFSTQLKFEEMQQFFTKYPEAGAGAFARKQALEKVSNNIKWLVKYKNTVISWVNSLE